MRERVLGRERDGRRSTIVLGLVAVGVGLVLAGLAWTLLLGPGGTVAVVPVEGVITGETSHSSTARRWRRPAKIPRSTRSSSSPTAAAAARPPAK